MRDGILTSMIEGYRYNLFVWSMDLKFLERCGTIRNLQEKNYFVSKPKFKMIGISITKVIIDFMELFKFGKLIL